MEKTIVLTVNGVSHALTVSPDQTLLEILRERLGFTGTKKGCDSGSCGACTVILNGEAILSCMTLAIRCDRSSILTIEGLGQEGELHPLQKSAIKHGAVQCGFCTPGWLMSAKALLDDNPVPALEEVRDAIAGNICRCTGYKQIEDAILDVAAGKVK